MKNVIYFCIGFLLLLIYRKYQERMGNLKPKKGAEGGSGGKELSKFRVYEYDVKPFSGELSKIGLRHIQGKEVRIEDLRAIENHVIIKVIHNLGTSFYDVDFVVNDSADKEKLLYAVSHLNENSFIITIMEYYNFDMTMTITGRD